VKFGLFEHMDDSGVPLGQQFESRLSLLEACDRYGFYAYHLAEHHGTPLGLAPSPGLFLAAVAQRTKRLRFGPLAYSLPLYHPIRLIEEICMLDQMSGGRLELGVGRGVSPFEVGFYGVNPTDGSRQFPEALRAIKQGLTTDELTFSGEFYNFKNVPMVLKPVQRPYPSLWYGIVAADAAYWAALEKAHIVTLLPPDLARGVIERYRLEWEKFGRSEAELPLMGVSRHVVLADTRAEAVRIAERVVEAYGAPLGAQRRQAAARAASGNRSIARRACGICRHRERVQRLLGGSGSLDWSHVFCLRRRFWRSYAGGVAADHQTSW
jgi:alkanesulfonate monooxygenase SsuD/methylene tetrahydromethanopterin reductase-like flavin-dependent oxidoreductase (luciferase family)